MSAATLDEICELVTDGTHGSPVRTEIGIPVLSAQHVNGGVLSFQTDRFTSDAEWLAFSRRVRPRRGDVLLTIVGSIGRVALVEDDRPAVFQRSVAILRPRAELCDPSYLKLALRSQAFSNQLDRATNQSSQAGVYLGKLGRLTIPLPPLPEQRRIAEILDRAETLRAQRRQALAQLDALGEAIFLEMFGEPVTNSRSLAEGTCLGDVAEVVSGVTKGRPLKGHAARVVPYLAVANVQDRRLALDVVKAIEATESEIERYRLRDGDLLLTEGGDPDKLGRGTLWRCELPECIHQNHVFRVRVNSPLIRPLFLNWLVGSQRGKRYFLRSAKQTTGIASINMTQLKGFPLLLPLMALQTQFEVRLAGIDSLRKKHLAACAEMEALFDSLQHRAFRGEL